MAHSDFSAQPADLLLFWNKENLIKITFLDQKYVLEQFFLPKFCS